MSVQLFLGDCLAIMPTLEPNSIDAIVCDPPAGIKFMNMPFDSDRGGRNSWIAWMSNVAAESLRLIKPGGHALVWALPRTSHWTATAWEDGGFEVRDCVYHIFGSGFPKSKNLGGGWGSALKPAAECWWLLRRPLSEKSLAANMLVHGVAGLNVDACRIGTEQIENHGGGVNGNGRKYGNGNGIPAIERGAYVHRGRWPANLILGCACEGDRHEAGCAVALLDEQSGTSTSKRADRGKGIDGATFKHINGATNGIRGHDDTGGASRFFYCAKSSRRDRNEGLEGMPEVWRATMNEGDAKEYHSEGRVASKKGSFAQNHHPTVKPTALCRYLVRLVTPPGGTVLDPFMGSGSTLKAAILEGFNCVGIEREPEYLAIAEARCAHAATEAEAQAQRQVQPALLEFA